MVNARFWLASITQILPNADERLDVAGPVGTLQKQVHQVFSIRASCSAWWVILVLALVELCNALQQACLSSCGCASLPRQAAAIFGSSCLRAQAAQLLLLFRWGTAAQAATELRQSVAMREQEPRAS
jgi:hypothetical protein